MRTQLLTGLLAALVGVGLFVAASMRLIPTAKAQQPTPTASDRLLPESVREVLRPKMRNHGQDLPALAMAVAVLDYPQVAQHAQNIADEPWLGRPIENDATELASRIPPEFFTLQDALRMRASRLRETAENRDAAKLGPGLASTLEVCVACHSTYVGPRSSPR